MQTPPLPRIPPCDWFVMTECRKKCERTRRHQLRVLCECGSANNAITETVRFIWRFSISNELSRDPTAERGLCHRLGIQNANLQEQVCEIVDATHALNAPVSESHEKCAGERKDASRPCQTAKLPHVGAVL